jgi:uncharacterized protein YnzC (UPF0291/DUF896 family)
MVLGADLKADYLSNNRETLQKTFTIISVIDGKEVYFNEAIWGFTNSRLEVT